MALSNNELSAPAHSSTNAGELVY